MSIFTILLGGEFTSTRRAIAQIAGSRVIAADAGMRHAAAIGLVPELWVGDFDSVPDGLPAELSDVRREQFPAEKDNTDGELAVESALARGADALILAGAFGGPRVDHALLHLTLAMTLSERGVNVLLTSGAQEGVPLVPGKNRFRYEDGTYFSIVAFSELSGLSVEGAKWPLNNVTVAFGSSRTISNEVRGDLTIELGGGRAILIAHPYPVAGF
jgi:thiamine pyrophosphokinase